MKVETSGIPLNENTKL